MDGQPEVVVVTAARAGDQRALDQLVGDYLPLVYNIIGRALPDRAEVDDVVQETMLRVLRGVGGLRDAARFRSWLVAVTMSQVREHRRSSRAAPGTSAFDETVELADPGADFVDLTITQLGLTGQRREVAEATRWLEPDDRHLLSLWWLEATGVLTRAELVAAIELDPHHVTVRVQRMKAQLDTGRVVVRALAVVPGCAELADVAASWHGRPESLWRKRFARHVRQCPYCAAHSADLVPVERLLAGIALLPAPAYAASLLAAAGGGAGGGGASGSGAGGTNGAGSGGTHSTSGVSGGRISRRHAGARGSGRLVGHLAAKPMIGALAVAVVAGVGVATAYSLVLRPGASQTLTLIPVSPRAVTMTATTTTTATTATATTTAAPTRTSAATTPPPSRTTTATTARPPAPTTAPSPVSTSPATSTTTTTIVTNGPLLPAQQVLALVNQARANAGLPAYTPTTGLAQSATAHNQLMASGCGLSHQCPGEVSLGARETAAGVTWTSCGENIGDSGPIADSDGAIATAAVGLTQAMLDEQPPDDGHRLNILSGAFHHIGIAVYRDASGTVWMTQDFSN
jgi:RNA polymerase sigma factor (sigma-70 family)